MLRKLRIPKKQEISKNYEIVNSLIYHMGGPLGFKKRVEEYTLAYPQGFLDEFEETFDALIAPNEKVILFSFLGGSTYNKGTDKEFRKETELEILISQIFQDISLEIFYYLQPEKIVTQARKAFIHRYNGSLTPYLATIHNQINIGFRTTDEVQQYFDKTLEQLTK